MKGMIMNMKVVKNYVNGEWVESKGRLIDVVSPTTQEILAKCPISTTDELNSAVVAAKDAFKDWRETPPVARARYLFKLKELLEENFEEISRIQTMEHGKTLDESRGETRRGIENVEVACGIPSLMMGYNLEDVSTRIDEYVINQPLGVFGIIGPFNFPFMIPLWSAPYAVATGNTIVVKPSSEVPLSQKFVAELVDEAGFPPGVWNVVNGGRDVVSGMLGHKDIKGITFVGSTPTAKIVYEECGKTHKRCIAQGGAKNNLVIMPDCDVKRTIQACMTSFFGNTGQRCLAAENLVVVGDDKEFYDEFVYNLVQVVSNITIGNGLDDVVQMGPVRDRGKKERILEYIEMGIKEGAEIILDGRSFKIKGDYPDTSFLGPTIFANVTPKMKIAREEIFGPVMNIIRAKDLDEAIMMCNESSFGNGHSIFTNSGKNAREFRYNVESGNVGVNIGVVAAMAMFPFSGMKDSFFGVLHTQGKDVIRFFTESKVYIERWF
jgi:malonate-semialdehyde dehydrogenase (acetylating)/methylmalonate-semialdehyde dehydrogenase